MPLRAGESLDFFIGPRIGHDKLVQLSGIFQNGNGQQLIEGRIETVIKALSRGRDCLLYTSPSPRDKF